MVTRAKAESNRSVHTAKSVQEFLDYLRPNAKHWNSARRGDLAYRGQAYSTWALVPRAFRVDQMVGYDRDAPSGGSNRVTLQVRAEFHALHQFVKAADTSGLQITEDGGRLLLQQDPRRFFDDAIGSMVGRERISWKLLHLHNIMAYRLGYLTSQRSLWLGLTLRQALPGIR